MRAHILGMVLVAAIAAPAGAATTITFAGSIAHGSDEIGLFGARGASLAGQMVDLTFTLDDAAAGTTDGAYARGEWTGISGPLSAMVTVAGRSAALPAGTDALIEYNDDFADADGILNHVFYSFADQDSYAVGEVLSYANDFLSGTSFATPIDYRVGGADGAGAGFRLVSWENGSALYSQAYFVPSTLHAAASGPGATGTGNGTTGAGIGADIGAVPEPAAWLMMLAGFGAVGLVVRRSRRRSAGSLASA